MKLNHDEMVILRDRLYMFMAKFELCENVAEFVDFCREEMPIDKFSIDVYRYDDGKFPVKYTISFEEGGNE